MIFSIAICVFSVTLTRIIRFVFNFKFTFVLCDRFDRHGVCPGEILKVDPFVPPFP